MVHPHIVTYIPLVIRGVFGGGVLPGISGGLKGLLLGLPVVDSGVGRRVHRRTVRIFNKGFVRVMVKKTPFGPRIRTFLHGVGFPCAVTCNVARYTPLVYRDH